METQLSTTNVPEVPPVTTPPPATPPNGAAPQDPATKPGEASDKFAALARKDKQVAKRAMEIAEKEKAIQEKEAAIEAREKAMKADADLAKSDPEAFAAKYGLNYSDWTSRILNKGKPTWEETAKMLQKRLDDLAEEGKTKEVRAAEEAKKAQEAAHTKTINDYKENIALFVTSKPEDYELLNFLDSKGLINSRELIFSGIQMVHKDKGVIPTTKEAADGVQQFLLENIEGLIANVKHFKEKYGKAEPPKPNTPLLNPDGSTTTITNNMSPGMGVNLPAATEDERIRRAMAAMEAAEK